MPERVDMQPERHASLLKDISAAEHEERMRAALQAAEKCAAIEWYGVGCVIVETGGGHTASGYTGEQIHPDGKFRHAEEVALQKASELGMDLSRSVLYSTLEPCSQRSPGKKSCSRHIIDACIPAVVFGAHEPFDPRLNIVCEGETVLRSAGVEVLYLKTLEDECLRSVVSKRRPPL